MTGSDVTSSPRGVERCRQLLSEFCRAAIDEANRPAFERLASDPEWSPGIVDPDRWVESDPQDDRLARLWSWVAQALWYTQAAADPAAEFKRVVLDWDERTVR